MRRQSFMGRLVSEIFCPDFGPAAERMGNKMPAYFNLSLQFRREDLYPDFVKDFFDALELAGLKYLSGYGEAVSDSRGEIIQWNQQKLEKDFVLGFTEHFSHGYRQVLYSFREYSEVRGFWMNQYPEKDCFTYEIIIPEEDVLIHEGGGAFQKEHEEAIVELAERLWNFPCIRAIQTGLEGDDASVGLREIELGKMPNMYPFAILEVMYGNEEIEEAVQLKGERMGWLLRRHLVFSSE